jgi:hypothetical protein
MPVAKFEKWDEELSRDSKNVPKLGGRMLATRGHPAAELLDQLIHGGSREPPVHLDRDEPLLSFQKSKQRNDIRAMSGFELAGARRLAAGALQLREKVFAQANLALSEPRRPTAARDQRPVELELARCNRLPEYDVNNLRRRSQPWADGLQRSASVEWVTRVMVIDEPEQVMSRASKRVVRVDAIGNAPGA